jgi:hypothetical protein
LNTLGAAYACAGRFQDAIAASQQALELARASNDDAAVDRTLHFIRRFKRGESIEDRLEVSDSKPEEAVGSE